jgi:riboflavin transporter FmnP
MKISTKKLVYLGILSAVASVLMFFPHFPIFPPPANFLDVDFSDVPALLAAITVNPFAGIIVVLVKNLFHLLFTQTFAIGELSNLILGTVFSLVVGILSHYTFKKVEMKKKLLFVLPVAVLCVTMTAMASNYFLVLPAFAHVMGWSDNIEMFKFVAIWIMPFNLIKSTIQVVVFYLLYRGLYPHLQKRLFSFK